MTFQAGAALRDISPKQPVALFGYPHVERISTGVHDPILASALYLHDGSRPAALVALDVLFLEPPVVRSIRRAVAEVIGAAESCVLVGCTHTHSGPVTSRLLPWQDDPTISDPDPAYLEFIERQAVEAAAEARAGARPAEIAWTTADARGVGGNRLDADGATDPEVGVLAVRRSGGGRLLAVAMIYGMHPTVLHEDSTLVSSDFPHYTRRHLQQRFGDELAVVYHTAPCGDQSPRRFVNAQTFAEAERLGRKLAETVARSISELPGGRFASECVLAGKLRELELPRRRLPSVEEARRTLAEYRAEHQRLESEGAERARVRTAECAVFGAEGALTLARAERRGEIDKTLEAYGSLEAQCLRIGDATLIGLPGELFSEYALRIKRHSPVKTFVVSLVGGHLHGYIVTPEAAADGGYEAAGSLFTPQAGAAMVETALSMLSQEVSLE